jgi:hypothetical protein
MSLPVSIEEVKNSRELKNFIQFPWKIYKGDKNWVPPLISERKEFFNPQKNPFYRHAQVSLFLAYRNGEIVGRIATLVNHLHNEFHQEKTGFFGFFEAINDFEVAKALLDKAKDWLKSKGMERMRGPANFSSNDEWGFLLEGFDKPPVVMMTYNPPYYLEFMEKYGMIKAKDLIAYYVDRSFHPPERVLRMAERVKQKQNVQIRTLNLKNFDQEVKEIKQIYNSAWSKNWGFIPMTNEEFDYLAKNLKQIVDPDFVLIAEVDGEPAGFCMALPDINLVLKKINGRLFPFGILKLLWFSKVRNIVKGMRVITMGVVHKYQKRGIDNLFYPGIYYKGIEKGYQWAEFSWILEDNTLVNRVLQFLGGKIYKKYRLYEIPF